MKNDRAQIQKDLAAKHEILDTARRRLKEEFIGIDGIIDTLVQNVSPWFLFPGIQERPIVINLWGMTGVGKTALVERLVELIDFQNRFFKFDLGDKDSSFSFHERFSAMVELDEKQPLIAAFDEFQHARTIDETGKEVSNDRNRNLWEMMASGKIHFFRWSHSVDELEHLADTLTRLLELGVEIRNGIITKGWEIAAKELDRESDPRGRQYGIPPSEDANRCKAVEEENIEDRLFVTRYQATTILELAGKSLNLTLRQDLVAVLITLSGNQAIQFLREVVRIGSRTIQKRFSRLLVFVLGNLDEAFSMAADLDADRNPEVFYQESLKIGLSQIKRALQARFRHEQIARFGNIHIIYPAIRSGTFEKVIEKELGRVAERVRNELGIGLEFDQSVNRLVYAEGVLPTQGFRPLFSTIHNLIVSNIGYFLGESQSWMDGVGTIRFKFENKALIGTYETAGGPLFSRKVTVPTHITDRREPRSDDRQASTAVHEAGHAVVHMALEAVLPRVILSVSSSDRSFGSVEWESPESIDSKDFIEIRATIMMGGIVAEKMIFGENGVTLGSEEDLGHATRLLSVAVKAAGLGKFQMAFGLPERHNEGELHFVEVEQEVHEWLLRVTQTAERILEAEKPLLLRLANHLSDHSRMEKAEILDFCRLYSVTGLFERIQGAIRPQGHRHLLKSAVSRLPQPEQPPKDGFATVNLGTSFGNDKGCEASPSIGVRSMAGVGETGSGLLNSSLIPPKNPRTTSEE